MNKKGLTEYHIPEYGDVKVKDKDGLRPAKRDMSIRHLLSMQSGLDYEFESPENHLSAYYGMQINSFKYSYNVIHPKIKDLIYE